DDAARVLKPRGNAADTLQPRAFQYEMLEESLRGNVVVAMDTGSGKTLIAILRIQAELERAAPEKLVWFLAPHVELATQQAKVIAAQIPSVQTRLLTGADGVEHWGEQWIWDEILRGIRIVISTHQVLLDALIHGFVQMARLSLLVFDEGWQVGVSLSAGVGNVAEIRRELEANLQAISRTPKLNREELLRYVYKPSLIRLVYPSEVHNTRTSQLVTELSRLRIGLNLEQDPYVKKMRADPAACDSGKLQKAILGRKTYCQEQLKNLNTRAGTIWTELGPWAADWYINACIRKFQLGIRGNPTDLNFFDEDEKIYLEQCLSSILAGITEKSLPLTTEASLSGKVLHLIEFLVSRQISDFTGLLFVRTRAEVAVLAQLLALHPKTKALYNVGTFVGTSSSASRKRNIGDLVDVRDQIGTLDDLRVGRKNLVITTSALEEGIDVTACNTVICFDKPPNLKSVIQRRGRARQSESIFVIMLAEVDDVSIITTWKQLEEKMQQQYMDDMRQLQELETAEEAEEGCREFIIEKTGAKLLLADAAGEKSLTAKVLLPISVDASVREACGQSAWNTEKMAKRDAAFEAYVQLYHAGLISDNLLPIKAFDEAIAEIKNEIAKVPSLVRVAGQFNPWYLVARQWQEPTDSSGLHCFEVSLDCNDELVASMQMLLPCPLPPIPTVPLYWDALTTFRATIYPGSRLVTHSIDLDIAARSTALLLGSIFRHRIDVEKTDFLALFIPSKGEVPKQWTERLAGTINAEKLKQIDLSTLSLNKFGIVRDRSQNGTPYVLRGFQIGSREDEVDSTECQQCKGRGDQEAGLRLQVSRFPKRTDFLHKVSEHNQRAATKIYKELLKPEDCEIDKLPLPYSYFAAMVPSILHRVGVRLVAAHLCNSLLAATVFDDLGLVLTAITTSAAQEPTNYQRQEFLGDSVLKFLTSLTLASEHLQWPEGHLTRAKDHIVSNASLAKAALAVGLDSFIVTESFTGTKWKPLRATNQIEASTGQQRQLSTKTLADVVEALIGAAFIDDGFAKAIAILRIFLPRVWWSDVGDRNEILHSGYQASDTSITYPAYFTQLEQLVGYTFQLKSLALEALTDSSYIGFNVTTSYERLEFLGDVCLDIIVSTTSFNHEPPIRTHSLHLIRSAVVNADFLAFLCLNLHRSVSRNNFTTGHKPNDVSLLETSVPIQIWNFVRHASSSIRRAQQNVLRRYESLRRPILESLQNGPNIPWALLARLDAPKFFSDIIESLIGAIYIDSHGSLAACEAFLEKLGVMGYLRRLLQGGVALYHPKEELGQLADTESVRYEVFRQKEEEKRLGCVVWIGERKVARVGDGVSVLEVETRAAEEAGSILKAERDGGLKKRKLDR
ncbi:MAG: hypothetical protein Q9184_006637, partial [Pyrenodesmia sp. 2 TL-2023]